MRMDKVDGRCLAVCDTTTTKGLLESVRFNGVKDPHPNPLPQAGEGESHVPAIFPAHVGRKPENRGQSALSCETASASLTYRTHVPQRQQKRGQSRLSDKSAL